MGYESRLYVVNKSTIHNKINGKEMIFAEIVAVFNLSKVYEVSTKMTKYPATNVYIYADDGDTEIIEDRYGKPLTEIPIFDAIKILDDVSKTDRYRRYKPCLFLLKSFDLSEWQNLVVLHYGY